MVGEGFTEKVAVLLDFVQITSTPTPPNLDNLYHFFNAHVRKKFGQGSPPPQIDPIYTVCEKRTKNLGRALPSPLIWTKSKRTATLFRETFAYSVR